MLALVEIERLVQRGDQRVGDLGARLPQGQAARVAGDLQRDVGRGRHDDGQRSGPETPRQQIEAIVQFLGQFLGAMSVCHQQRQRAMNFAALGAETHRPPRADSTGRPPAYTAHRSGWRPRLPREWPRRRVRSLPAAAAPDRFPQDLLPMITRCVHLARTNGFRHFDRHLITSERRAQLYALHHAVNALHHLARDRDAFLARLVRRYRPAACAPCNAPAPARAVRSP